MQEVRAKNPQIERALDCLRAGVDVEASFRLIFDFYYRPVFGFFQRKTFSPEEAGDLTQETFFRVYHKREQFRGDAPFEAWLWQIAWNVYRKRLAGQRTQKRAGATVSLDQPAGDGSDEPPEFVDELAPSPLGAVLELEKSEVLKQAIAGLSEQQQRCVRLRVEQDLSYAEIAVVLRLSIETVKAHLFQARRQLKQKLRGYFGEADFLSEKQTSRAK